MKNQQIVRLTKRKFISIFENQNFIGILIILIVCNNSLSQTSTNFLENGKRNFEMLEFESALEDFTKCIQLDSTFQEAYLLRAIIFNAQYNFQEAIADLDKLLAFQEKTIEINQEALKLRGEIYLKLQLIQKACDDFQEAMFLGAIIQKEYLNQCSQQQVQLETVFFQLPNKNEWKITSQFIENNTFKTILQNVDDTMKKSTELIRISSEFVNQRVDLIKSVNDSFQLEKSKSPNAKLSFIENNSITKEPWVIYLVENTVNSECQCEEFQIWYLVQGAHYLHTYVSTIRKDAKSKQKIETMKKVFKNASVVYE